MASKLPVPRLANMPTHEEQTAAATRHEEETLDDKAATGEEVQMACDMFRVERFASSWAGCAPCNDWTQRYTLGKAIGSGQTATVYEAYATWPVGGPLVTPRTPRGQKSPRVSPRKSPRSNAGSTASSGKPAPCRRVALKKFPVTGTEMFQQELRALRTIGVHPHVLRLLESFQGPSEDILVLEHCAGGDVYDLYAGSHGCCMLEPFVVHLVRQLLLALQHLAERGVEHRDVKPENLLLYSASDGGGSIVRLQAAPHLKLADFGWAHVHADDARPQVPSSGVGSLWYASPELNPPPDGDLNARGLLAASGDATLGACDMWSVGVIAYLLLLGHSPFNVALREQDQDLREAKVIRLAAQAKINRESHVWNCISDEARDFIEKLIQVEPAKRMTPMEAWSHPFVSQGAGRVEGGNGSSYLAKLPPLLPVADMVWRRLDAFQRLCWITFAHAVSEPELVELRAFQMFITQQSMEGQSYLHMLAVELAAVAQPSWFHKKTVWMDPLRLAFCYLDVDNDGVLSIQDLAKHLVGKDAEQTAQRWFHKWYQPPAGRNGNGGGGSAATKGITFGAYKWALCSSHAGQSRNLDVWNGIANVHADGQAEDASHDAILERRMQAIDEVCQRFLDEEFDDFGFGF